MIFLVLSVLSSTSIFILFKLFKLYNVDTLQAIVYNYITASICGIILFDKKNDIIDFVNEPWFYVALVLGFLFISIFNVMALTAQKNGLSVASVASKMSVIIPILFGIIVYNESVGFYKIVGIMFALVAVVLASIKPKSNVRLTKTIYLPIILFLGSGVIETSVNHFAPEGNMPLFLAIIFASAGIIGLILVSIKTIKEKQVFKVKAIPFGFALGLVNYCSMYFLLKALRVEGFESSVVFTVNNVAIVAVSCLTGLLLFKEVISSKNWFGIGLALISIILVTL
ncbi:DMT family transporter [Winogradskyella algicola]|uniref:DMT family transporter n=1 Tax=Winogradskyella algicola TaxID=2575815 RepID=UPI001107FB35|nr:DMT family transporter [Winogradskyella algicola]